MAIFLKNIATVATKFIIEIFIVEPKEVDGKINLKSTTLHLDIANIVNLNCMIR